MKKNYFTLFLVLFSFFSCKEETNHNDVLAESLQGTWQVIEATRNNRPAKSLEKAEFYINDSTFATNFLPDKTAYKYAFDGENVRVMSPKKSEYAVQLRSSDTLILKTEIKNFDFKFISIKKANEEDSN